MTRFFPDPIERNIEEQTKFRFKTFWLLLLLFVLAAIAILPHSRAIKTLAYQAGESDKMNIPIFESLVWTAGMGLIMGALFIWIGFWLSARAKLGAPVLAGMISGKSMSDLISRKVVITSILMGVVISVFLLGLLDIQKSFFSIDPPKFKHPSALPSFLASFSAGITEEIIFRLGLMSLIVSVLQYFVKRKTPSNKIIWTGNIVAGVIFGLIHLPMSNNYYELTSIVIGTTVIGNTITGTTFGWIFWRYGLLMAMLAHFCFDIVFHVIASPFG
jgi:hypothetical protein